MCLQGPKVRSPPRVGRTKQRSCNEERGPWPCTGDRGTSATIEGVAGASLLSGNLEILWPRVARTVSSAFSYSASSFLTHCASIAVVSFLGRVAKEGGLIAAIPVPLGDTNTI